jgi:large subunit ribosomal protein L28
LQPQNKNYKIMARVCQLTGKKVISGNNVSHSNARTRRKFYPNLQVKRYFVPEEGRWVTLKLSTSAMRSINKNGVSAEIKKAIKKGLIK